MNSSSSTVQGLSPSELRRQSLFSEFSQSTLVKMRDFIQPVQFERGQTICQQDQPGDAMFIVVHGRVKVATESDGRENILKFLDSDEHFGEMSMLTGNRRTANVIAVTNTKLFRIDRAAFDQIQQQEPSFSWSISNTLARRLASSVSSRPPATINRTIAVLFASSRARDAAYGLERELKSLGLNIHVVNPSRCKQTCNVNNPSHHHRCAGSGGTTTTDVNQLCEQHDRVLLIRSMDEAIEDQDLLSQCDRIVCFVDRGSEQTLDLGIVELLRNNPKLAPRIHRVFLLDSDQQFAPKQPEFKVALGRDFKVSLNTSNNTPNLSQGLRRIVRFLLDQRIGIALGGGGARGLAHLGVLKALDEEGIGVDLIAGTSMGALIGLSYVAGWSPEKAQNIFCDELTPGWFFRNIPRGRSWYMISKFRWTGWENMLRKFFVQATFEQLQLPFSTVSADLIRGGQVIRESGDAVNAILESINLPHISRPIVRDGQVLVDGGLLNNVPVDLLRPRGANIAIGVDVCSHLPNGFGRKNKKSNADGPRRPSFMETVFRLNAIRRYRVSRRSLDAADHMIWVDTSQFEFEDFSNAHHLAAVGYQAAQDSIPHIKRLVDERLMQALKSPI